MINRGVATFTLDTGRCPRWLFERMVKLAREMVYVIISEEGPDEFIRRIGDPAWFQALGTVLAFDWNASGLTTILTAALKEAIRGRERELGIFICGGKGKTSRKTPDEILSWGEVLNLDNAKNLVYNSKMAAKVDSALVQDGFQIYHHSFFFTKNGAWTVVQQGMDQLNRSARRYHWHSKNIKDLVCEPHSGISSQKRVEGMLDLTSQKSSKTRAMSNELVLRNSYEALMKDIRLLSRYSTPLSQMEEYGDIKSGQKLKLINISHREFKTHPVAEEDFSKSKYLAKILWKLCDMRPENYEKLLSTEGVGPKTMRALALVSEVIYGAKPSYEDPARYSFAHGGKDGTPYFVDRTTYDQTIDAFRNYVRKMKLSANEKQQITARLKN